MQAADDGSESAATRAPPARRGFFWLRAPEWHREHGISRAASPGAAITTHAGQGVGRPGNGHPVTAL